MRYRVSGEAVVCNHSCATGERPDNAYATRQGTAFGKGDLSVYVFEFNRMGCRLSAALFFTG